MGQATNATLRLEVIAVHRAEKLSYGALAKRFKLSYNTVRTICIEYEKHGTSSLTPDFSNCGRKISDESEKAYRLVRLIAHLHEDWGVPYILTKIKFAFPQLKLQSIRTYQRRLAKERPNGPLPVPVVPKIKNQPKARQAHDEWQIDAKERIVLPNGKEVCYLNITDTKSHSLIKVKPFPPCTDQFS